MQEVPLFLRSSSPHGKDIPFGFLTVNEFDHCVYNDERKVRLAPLITVIKFACLTIASPVISMIQIARVIMLLSVGQLELATKALFAVFGYPILGFLCLMVATLGLIATAFGIENNVDIYCRRIYALFEISVNTREGSNVGNLASYTTRIRGNPPEFTWYFAPCFQPLFQGNSCRLENMQRAFPLYDIQNVTIENKGFILTGQCKIAPKYTQTQVYTYTGHFRKALVTTHCFFFRSDHGFFVLGPFSWGTVKCISVFYKEMTFNTYSLFFCTICCLPSFFGENVYIENDV